MNQQQPELVDNDNQSGTKSVSLHKYGGNNKEQVRSISLNKQSMYNEDNAVSIKTPAQFSLTARNVNINRNVGVSMELHACRCNRYRQQELCSPLGNQDVFLPDASETAFMASSPTERYCTNLRSPELMMRASEPQVLPVNKDQICGLYCKNLKPDQQRQVVLNCFKQKVDYSK